MVAPRPKGNSPRALRRPQCLFATFVFAVITLVATINVSVLSGSLDLTTTKDDSSLGESLAVRGGHQTFGPLLDLLAYANVSIQQSDLETFPKWNEVVSRFGAKPRILGLETCTAFRHAVPFKRKRVIAPAGTFNSGTNLLFNLLAKNCRVSKNNPETLSKTGVDWQVVRTTIWSGRVYRRYFILTLLSDVSELGETSVAKIST